MYAIVLGAQDDEDMFSMGKEITGLLRNLPGFEEANIEDQYEDGEVLLGVYGTTDLTANMVWVALNNGGFEPKSLEVVLK